jgi:lipopolysaccharide/colanic/teichoic acid biosynthesis glycosyltransferase
MLDRSVVTERAGERPDAGRSRLGAILQRLDANRHVLVIMYDVAIAVLALPLAFMLHENALLLPARRVDYILSALPLVAIAALAASLLIGSYRAVWRYLGTPEIIRVAQMALAAVLIFQLGQFFVDRLEGMPRAAVPLQFLIMLFLMLASRIFYGELLRRTEGGAGVPGKPALLIGSGDGAALFIRLRQLSGQHEFEPVGILCDKVATNRSIAGVPVLGDLADFDRVVANLRVQGMPPAVIVITRPHHEIGYTTVNALIEKAAAFGINTAELPDLMRFKGDIRDSLAPPMPATITVYPKLKRVFDILVSAGVLVFTAPLLALAALAVALFIQRPVLFVQVRPGLARRPIRLVKFRTMRDPLDARGNRLTDAERTPLVGRILRRARLDELPQFWNVLIGDMAIIGPRPLLSIDLEAMPDQGEARCRARPGITGWAQVNGGHQLAPEEKLALDRYYIEHASFQLDARIVWRTIMMMLFGEKRDETAITAAQDSFAMAAVEPAAE